MFHNLQNKMSFTRSISGSRSSRFSCAASARHFAVVLTVASIVIVIAVPSQAQTDSEEMLVEIQKRASDRAGAVTYCGRSLVDALHMACQGAYHGPFPKNKKNYGIPEDELMRQQENDPEFWEKQSQENTYDLLQGLQSEPGNNAWLPRPARFPFRERLNARAFLSHALRRSIRGVHDECCSKSCTIHELRSYCAS